MSVTRKRVEDLTGVDVHHVEANGDGDPGFVRFDCPSCGKEIHESFQLDALQMLVHPGGSCRLVVDVDPMERDHRILVNHDPDLSLEELQRQCSLDRARQAKRVQAGAAYLSKLEEEEDEH